MLDIVTSHFPDYCAAQLAVLLFYSAVYYLTTGNSRTANYLIKFKFNKNCALCIYIIALGAPLTELQTLPRRSSTRRSYACVRACLCVIYGNVS